MSVNKGWILGGLNKLIRKTDATFTRKQSRMTTNFGSTLCWSAIILIRERLMKPSGSGILACMPV